MSNNTQTNVTFRKNDLVVVLRKDDENFNLDKTSRCVSRTFLGCITIVKTGVITVQVRNTVINFNKDFTCIDDEQLIIRKQRFNKLSFVRVKVGDYLPMSHFDTNFDGIINGSYHDLYGGASIDQYSVYKIEKGKVVNRISWYNEDQLTLLPKQCKKTAQVMINKYDAGIR